MRTALESLLPAAHCALPQRNRIDGLVSGPGCSSVLWLISGDPDRYQGSASDQSSSICGQLPAEVSANQSSSGFAMTSQVLFLFSVFTGNQAQENKSKGKSFLAAFSTFNCFFFLFFPLHHFIYFFIFLTVVLFDEQERMFCEERWKSMTEKTPRTTS